MDVGARDGQRILTVEDFSIPQPREFEEAWDNLDIFPSGVVFDLANIRSSLRTLDAAVLNFKPDQRWTFDWLHIPPEVAGTIKIYRDLEGFADAVSAALRNEVSRLHPGQ
jgi:hypothetical protein